MENNKRNSERDKMLEDILSAVGKDSSGNTGKSRAERAAASSANRSSFEKRMATSDKTASYSSSESRPSESIYSRTTKAKMNPEAVRREETTSFKKEDSRPFKNTFYKSDTERTTVMRSTNDTGKFEKTGSVPDYTDSFDRTKSKYSENLSDDEPLYRSVNTANPEVNRKSSGNNKRKKKKNAPSGRLPLVLILTTVIFTVAISLSVLIISVGRDMLAIGKSDDIKIITVPEGSTTEDVAQLLYDEGIIKIPKAFMFISKLGGADTKYIAGEHQVSPSYAYETLINELTTDRASQSKTVDVTFLEGCDLISAGQKLEEAGVCEAERFVYYFNAGDYGFEFEKYLPVSTASKFNRMEGYLFPDTYTFYVDTDPEIVCQKIYKNFDDKFKAEYYAKMIELNMTLDEVITLASIVQAESPDVKTMKNVASVFENRLNNPEVYPKLQSDPTSNYVEEVIMPNIEIKSEAIFEAYDTYICNGLPPGAIGNPGLDAIEAVLYPADTDYYFFYANIDTMETFYAETNEEHEENIKMVKKQREEAKKGE